MKLSAPALAAPLALILAACHSVPDAPPPEPQATELAAPPPAQQWLYGSAEARIVMVQEWNAIAVYIESVAAQRPNMSVVLAPGATADVPDFLACGDKPLAAVFDADETLIWNLGSTAWHVRAGREFDFPVWLDWERTGAGKAVPVPGALESLARIRAAGVEVIVNTNREAENAGGTAKTLEDAGTGTFVHGSTLWLCGDAPGGSGKDGRRNAISENYCVIALVGDQLGDIADIFNAKDHAPPQRKALSAAPAFAAMWGKGWFILPNPVYGPSIAGTMEEVFPPETYWEPSSGE
ncbi:HAD family acid phosphatase [Hyphomonas sp.]|uniref:HAD family acid phosphatase n=1 Tax=Hyphomonas sp. TaxID=87 RepID=UPI00391AB91B